MVWLMGGSLTICLVMIVGMLWLVFDRGMRTFWPTALVEVETIDGKRFLGEVTEARETEPDESTLETLAPDVQETARSNLDRTDGTTRSRRLRTGNFELTNDHFTWVYDHLTRSEKEPEWALLIERQEWGRFYGYPAAFRVGEEVVAEGPEATWKAFQQWHGPVRERGQDVRDLQQEIAHANRSLERERLAVRSAELAVKADPSRRAERDAAIAEEERVKREAATKTAALQARSRELEAENAKYVLVVETADGKRKDLPLATVVRAMAPNRMGFGEKVEAYASRWWEFLWDEPREANSEGGVWPAIFGTVAMTLIMSLLVVPFGVLAALYLKEYARTGPITSLVRIAINNLAGVPSIVFGVFGLGFFCYFVGVGIDELFFPEHAPNPVYGKGGILWASLTLALLTLPVVVVATEEALAAVPGSLREGSYACGASKWQTIRRIVLPRAMPGIITGMILAVARGAGEVAPLMMVGAVKLAPDLPVDGIFPYVHPERSFMHLGFHIYDLGFQSQNSEAAKPMVFSTTLLLLVIVVALNALGIWVRARLRRKYGVDA
jgi:phosphate transport system permease protein